MSTVLNFINKITNLFCVKNLNAKIILILLTATATSSYAQIGKTVLAVNVHGNAFVAQNESLLTPDGVRRSGWGASFTAPAGTQTWFHVPFSWIQLPMQDVSLKVQSVVLFFKSSQTVVTDVQVWDGAKSLQSFQKLQLKGDYSARTTADNTFAVTVPYPPSSGAGVSVAVTFANDGLQNGKPTGEIIFTGAQMKFEAIGSNLSERWIQEHQGKTAKNEVKR